MFPTLCCWALPGNAELVASHSAPIQGLLRIRASDCGVDPAQDLVKLWVHEHSLIYSYRCSQPDDSSLVKELLHRLAQRKLGSQDTVQSDEQAPLIFSEFVNVATSGVSIASSTRKGPRPYELVTGTHLPISTGTKKDCNFIFLETHVLVNLMR